MDENETGDWETQEVQTTVKFVADRIHQQNGRSGEHSQVHSCSCEHLARYYLGLIQKHGLYWPDGNGGNSWNSDDGKYKR